MPYPVAATRGKGSSPSGAVINYLTLTAILTTNTTAGKTITLTKLTPTGSNIIVDWGDSNTTTIA